MLEARKAPQVVMKLGCRTAEQPSRNHDIPSAPIVELIATRLLHLQLRLG